MFIPRGEPLHENLATSFVLVDALVHDLSEGGFSGLVEVVLRDSDCYVLLSQGQVLAVFEKGDKESRKMSLADLAAESRSVRGRISVYHCSSDTALAVAGRMFSEVLYSRLSTEFADLDKMISKLGRERDREWFVDIETGNGLSGLIHVKDQQFRGIASDPEAAEGTRALQRLLEECKKSGATFDVHYRAAGEPFAPVINTAPAAELEPESREDSDSETVIMPAVEGGSESEEKASLAADKPEPSGQPIDIDLLAETLIEPALPVVESAPVLETESASTSSEELLKTDADQALAGTAASAIGAAPSQLQTNAVEEAGNNGSDAAEAPSARTGTPPKPTRVLTGSANGRLAEIRALMALIASTIENAARAVEPRDTFSIYLRAGQLKIADRYPFLDPFGNEFEYNAGQITFAGEEDPDRFIEGLTEALRLAVVSIIEASAQPANLRSRVEDELFMLESRERVALRRLGMKDSIEKIIGE